MSPIHFKYKRPLVSFMAILLLFLIVADVLIVSTHRRQMISGLKKHWQSELDMTGIFIAESLLKREYANVENFLVRSAKTSDNIVEINAATPNNFVLVQYRREKPSAHTFLQEKQIRYGGKVLLDLKVVRDLEPEEKSLRNLQLQLIAGSILVTIIMGMAIWFSIRRMALRPLEREITKRRLAEEQLQKVKDDLEIKVQERTKELIEINENLLLQIAGRKKAEQHIMASLREKEVLLKEIHHRVKNNMQIITSLLRLQAGKSADEKEIEMLRESRNRIRSMSLIHEKLYRTSDLSHINFKDYIDDLTRGLYRSYGIDKQKISCDIVADDILLEVDTAIPCGLIVNELVSNALKYAFPGERTGTINVRLRRIMESEIENEELISKTLELTVSDNGIGITKDFDFKNAGSLGLKLVATLSENQLNGKIQIDDSEGTRFLIRFKEKSYEEELK